MGSSKLSQAIKETREFLELNRDGDVDDDDALELLETECGQDGSGGCSQAGTEYCDWECPFND